MKKVTKISIPLILVAILIASIVYVIPKKINTTMTGLKYRLGSEYADDLEEYTFTFEGQLQRRIFSHNSFDGYITIKTKENEESNYGSIAFNKHAGSVYFDEYEGYLFHVKFNEFFLNNNMTKMSIRLYKIDEEDSSHSSWDGADGYIIAAPASTREEALDISNEVYNLGESAYILE